jgi:hypothetical protein
VAPGPFRVGLLLGWFVWRREGAHMAEAAPSADAPTTGTVSGSRLPCFLAAAVSVIAALRVVYICLNETPTAVYSFCGTCREVARSSLYGESVWAVAASVAAAAVARLSGRAEFRVARSAAVVAIAVWVISLGFVRGWW